MLTSDETTRFGSSMFSVEPPGIQIPNPKDQAPEKSQCPKPEGHWPTNIRCEFAPSKPNRLAPHACLGVIGAWNLELLWSLEVGDWCFSIAPHVMKTPAK